jgi:dTDP-4-amino-4,6-dideoxygalactose transaminase
MIPQTDPGASYRAHQTEIDEAIGRVNASGRYILGPEVEAFEAEFAAYVGVKHCVGVANGTDALRLAIEASVDPEIRHGFTVSMSATATVAAMVSAGKSPIWVDIHPDEFTLDPAALAAAPGEPQAFVVPVHLYGQPAKMVEIMRWAEQQGVVVIEDCAQAHGAALHGRRVGSFGLAGAFSFYPTKNLGALGDGGAVVTNSDAVAEQVRLLRMYGWRERYISDLHGGNSRLDELQAAILRVKLRHLDAANARRVQIAETYTQALSGLGLKLPAAGGVYHQYVVCHPRRDQLRRALESKGVGTSVLYPVPIHRQPAYADRQASALPNTAELARTLICLPVYPELSDSEVEYVCSTIREALLALGASE